MVSILNSNIFLLPLREKVANGRMRGMVDLGEVLTFSSPLIRPKWGTFSLMGRREGREGDHPTDPSKLIPISFCVSAMNSIGSCCSTSRTKPLTMRATDSSCDKPRLMQ